MRSVHSSPRFPASRPVLGPGCLGRNVRTLRSRTHRPGAILLEVLISIALMAFSLAVIGLQISTSLESARKNQLWTTAIVLTETKMAELQAGAVAFKPTDQQVAGYFGIRYPGFSWRIGIEPCDIENLYMMTLQIGFNPSVIESQIANPDMEIDFEDEGTTIVRTVYRLVPKPADLDLNRDFGVDLEGLQEQMGSGGGEGGGEGGEGGSGGNAGNELWNLITEFLTQHPEILNDNGGIDLEAVKNLPPEDFQAAMQILEQFVGRGSQISQLQEQLGDALGEGDDNGRGGRGSSSGNGGSGRDGNNDQDGDADQDNGTGTGGGTGQNGAGTSGQGRGGRNGGRGRDSDGTDGGRGNNGGNERPGRGRDGDAGEDGAGGRNFGRGRDGANGGTRGDNRNGNDRGRGRDDGAGRDNQGGGRNNDRSGRGRENGDNASNSGGRSNNSGRQNDRDNDQRQPPGPPNRNSR